MRKALGNRASFVGADNGGHYVYGTGNACAGRITHTFLTSGELPTKDLLNLFISLGAARKLAPDHALEPQRGEEVETAR